MTTLSAVQVAHIAKLARLTLKEREADTMSKELSSILTYVDLLSEVNTEGVEPTAQVTGLESVFREDAVRQSEVDRDHLLECSPLRIVDDQIEAPHAHG
jgi:aspartyl-tRNA(Asn)/glutamyl-tRNA(Gln) amidotransferase subunit C